MKIAYLYSQKLNWYSAVTADILRTYGEVDLYDNSELHHNFESYDVVFVEFIGEAAVVASHQKIKNLIIRTHGVEVYMAKLERVNWDNVKTLLFFTDHQRDYFQRRQTTSRTQFGIMRYPAPKDKFTLSKELLKNNIAFVANITGRKGSDQIPALLEIYKDKNIFAVGKTAMYGDPVFEFVNWNVKKKGYENRYIYRKNVGWDQMNTWLEGKGYAWLPSIQESFGKVILESMCKGITPIIRNWAGAEEIWPEEFIYEKLTDLEGIFKNTMSPQEIRDYVVEKFSFENIKNELKLFI